MAAKTTTHPRYDRDEVILVACPHCGVPAGHRCVTAGGRSTLELHTLRKGVVYPRYLVEEDGEFKRGLILVSEDEDS
jgi:hypothetical protein